MASEDVVRILQGTLRGTLVEIVTPVLAKASNTLTNGTRVFRSLDTVRQERRGAYFVAIDEITLSPKNVPELYARFCDAELIGASIQQPRREFVVPLSAIYEVNRQKVDLS